VLQVQGLSVEV